MTTMWQIPEQQKTELTTLKNVAENDLGIASNTLRKYRSRNLDTFPKPVTYGPGGLPTRWRRQEILDWWEYYKKEVRKQKGTGQRNPSARAKLGHKFKAIRDANTCNECLKHFVHDEEHWEVRTGNDLQLLCELCYQEQKDQKND